MSTTFGCNTGIFNDKAFKQFWREFLLALLELGKGTFLGAFLEGGRARALAAAEAGTVTRCAFKISDTKSGTSGTFDIFETKDDRQAHLPRGTPPRLVRWPPIRWPRTGTPSCRRDRRRWLSAADRVQLA
ncbi:MAG: hypothetical protein ACYCXN_08010 [Acidimicrobiales bacterium]